MYDRDPIKVRKRLPDVVRRVTCCAKPLRSGRFYLSHLPAGGQTCVRCAKIIPGTSRAHTTKQLRVS